MPPVHDYVIDNSTGANVRADINSVLQAILTNNSSSSAPSTTAAYMFWADTTSGTLKIRNSSNNAWVELLQLDGTLTLEDGSNSAPALAFRDDLDTGVFSSEANAFNIATAGVERIEFGTTECVVNDTGANVDFRIEGDTDANLFKVDAGNDRIGIGTSSPDTLLTLSQAATGNLLKCLTTNNNTRSQIQLQGKDSSGNAVSLKLGGDGDSGGNIFTLTNHRLGFATNNAAPQMILDTSGNLGIGMTPSGMRLDVQSAANDIARFTGTNSGGITFRNDTSNEIQIHTGSFDALIFGTNGENERVRISSDGKIGIGTSSPVNTVDISSATNTYVAIKSTTASTGNQASLGLAPANSLIGTQFISESTEDFSTTANRSAKLLIQNRLDGTFYDNLEIAASGNAIFKSVTNGGNHLQIDNTTTSNTGCMLNINSSRNTTNTSYFLAQWGSTSVTRFEVTDAGNVRNINNSYGAISDQTLKENIVDAGSQWDDIKNLKVRKFNFIETTDPDKKTMLGVVAQEAETVCPYLVETSKTKQGGEEKEYKTFKYSVLYMKAIKCLQEAQAKIEVLETKVAALEAA